MSSLCDEEGSGVQGVGFTGDLESERARCVGFLGCCVGRSLGITRLGGSLSHSVMAASDWAFWDTFLSGFLCLAAFPVVVGGVR